MSWRDTNEVAVRRAREDDEMVRVFSGLSVGVLLIAMSATAEDDRTNRRSNGVIETATSVAPAVGIISPQENDRRVAKWVGIDNDGMITFAEMAERSASASALKELARSIAVEHKRVQDTLKTFTSVQIASRNGPAKPPAASQTAALLKDDGLSRNGQLVFRPTDFLDVKERVCKSLQSQAEGEFRKLEGTEFDHAFVTHMIFSHEAMAATIGAVKGDTTASFAKPLHELEQMTQKHLKELRRLRNEQGGNVREVETVTEVK